MKIKMTIWDNTITDLDRHEVLRYCERAINKTCRLNGCEVKTTNRWSCGITFEVNSHDFYRIARQYNDRLIRFHYWNEQNEDGFEKLVMEYK